MGMFFGGDGTMRLATRTDMFRGQGAAAWQAQAEALERLAAGQEAFLLTIGNSDFATPASVIETACASLNQGRTHYAPMTGERSLREAIAARHARRTGQSVSADQVVVTAGAQNALMASALCIADPGDEIIVPEPMYVTYPATLATAGANVVGIRSPAQNGFHPLIEDLARAVTPRTRAIFLATPNNPTGAVYSRAELQAIGEICAANDLWLVSDEVYADLVHDGQFVSPASLPILADRTITISSLSKSHAMAGWRLGWLVAPPEFAEAAGRHGVCSTFGVPPFIQDAAVTALKIAPNGIEEIRATYDARRKRVCERLDGVSGLRCRLPEAGMFVMLDIRTTGLSAQDFALGLVRTTGVATLPTDSFGPSATGFVRISLGFPDGGLDEAIRRIAGYASTLV